MRCIAVPEVTLRTVVEEAEALDQVIQVIGSRQVPAVRDCLTALRCALRELGTMYHQAMEDGEEANHVRLRRPEAARDTSDRHR